MDNRKRSLLLTVALLAGVPASSDAAAPPDSGVSELPMDLLTSLRAAVQGRLVKMEGNTPRIPGSDGVEQQLAQWFNFPNFTNVNSCYRAPWRNC
jgi:hypothetical protein